MDENLLNFDDLIITSKDIFGDWESLIVEHDGDFSQKNQSISFQFGPHSIDISFRLRIIGNHWYIPESYLQPSEGEVNISEVDVTISDFTIDDEQIENKQVIQDMEKSLAKLLISDVSLL